MRFVRLLITFCPETGIKAVNGVKRPRPAMVKKMKEVLYLFLWADFHTL
jgi:hypothetical protein